MKKEKVKKDSFGQSNNGGERSTSLSLFNSFDIVFSLKGGFDKHFIEPCTQFGSQYRIHMLKVTGRG